MADTKMRYVLPESAVALIHQLSDSNDMVQLSIGDLSAELVDEAEGIVPAHVVRAEIAREYRAEPVTITDRERVARLVPVPLRDKHPPLSFHQWRAICSVKDKAQIPLIAQWAVENGDSNDGRPASVRAIRRMLTPVDTEAWEARWKRALEILSLVRDDDDAPNVVRTLAHHVCEKAKHLSY